MTDLYGNMELDLPADKYELKVSYLGCEPVIIREIDFKPYTRTEIRVELGAEDNSLGLPSDEYLKRTKHKGMYY